MRFKLILDVLALLVFSLHVYVPVRLLLIYVSIPRCSFAFSLTESCEVSMSNWF